MPTDPDIAAVERLLGAARRHESDPGQLDPGHRVAATFALWLCTCGGDDDSAPTWLLFDRGDDGRIGWCRLPDRTGPLDLVDAKDTAGGHTSPAEVLLWLERAEAHPWGGSGSGSDVIVLKALRKKILAA